MNKKKKKIKKKKLDIIKTDNENIEDPDLESYILL